MQKIKPKTSAEIEAMLEGGKKLGAIKKALGKAVKEGVSAKDIDDLADRLITESGGESSFKKVKGYRWSTCVNTNSGVVHGIPHPHIVFKKGDVVSVDVGLYYKGFHTDTSLSVEVGTTVKTKFLDAGRAALMAGIKNAKAGNTIYDISYGIESTLKKNNLTPIYALVGHGIGKNLHEDPQIPCFVSGSRAKTPVIPEGSTFAIEVMYTEGSGEIFIDDADGWTIFTRDGKISALFEETVVVSKKGPIILTN